MSPGAPKPKAAERVEVMLCVLPWLAATGGAPLSEVALKFGVDPGQLRADLRQVFYEVATVDPGTMVEVRFDGEEGESEAEDPFVTVHLPGSFEEPPGLDHDEALKLLVAGSAMAGQPGAEAALDPALDKLAASLGEGARGAVQVDLGGAEPAIREVLHAAVRDRRQVRIDYFAWTTDEVSRRTVDPWAVRSIEGHWYLTGHCHERDALRHFRLDRILSAEPAGDPGAFERPEEVDPPDADFTAGGRTVRLAIPHDAAWVVESYPVQAWEDREDHLEVTLGVHNDTWLERLLLRLPPEARATDADTGEDLGGHRDGAARRILARHGVSGDTDDPR